MDISGKLKSRYLKPENLPATGERFIISHVTENDVPWGGDSRLVAHLKNGDKLGLTATRLKALANAYGPETDRWRDKIIILRPDKVGFNGGTTATIVVEIPTLKDPSAEQDQVPY
jgi:hypothetical protein